MMCGIITILWFKVLNGIILIQGFLAIELRQIYKYIYLLLTLFTSLSR